MPIPNRNAVAEMEQLQQDLAQSALDNSAKQAYINICRLYISDLEKYVKDRFGEDALVDFKPTTEGP